MRKIISLGSGIIFCLLTFTSCSSPQKAPEPKPIEQPMPVAPPQVEEKKVKNNVRLEKTEVGGLTEAQLVSQIQGMAREIDKEPAEAKVDEKQWTVTGTANAGKKVDVDTTKQAVMNAKEGETIKLTIKEIKPQITAEQLKANIVEIGSYTTSILDKDPDRVKNIQLASEKMNMKKIGPGEVFSFNAVVGQRTEAKGYEEAPIIKQTKDGPKKEESTGGGVCQLSTTLYNAAQKAGLEIVERHLHSKDIGYVPKGQDATVSYGTVDFKFKNNRSHPIMIRTYMDKNNTLTVKIFENRN